MRLFGGSDAKRADAEKQRVPRHSSGWEALRTFLREEESLRVLDVGPTSATNINLLTSWGHSIYMADLVTEAKSSAYTRTDESGAAVFDMTAFLDINLPLSGRLFDVVLFWDAGDYLPSSLMASLFGRLHDAMNPGGKLLAFGHVKPDTGFYRYHLRDDGEVDLQHISDDSVKNTYTNRQLETFLHPFANYRFFLAKDNLREVLVNR